MLILAAALLALPSGSCCTDLDWPSFRGPGACGVAHDAATRTTWDLESGEGVLWRTPIPGMAHSSPIAAGGKLFVMSALRLQGIAELKVGLYGSGDPVPAEGPHRFEVSCLDAATGELLWRKVAREGEPRSPRHPKSSQASSTPATDGEHVLAFFGSEGLYCYDVEGELLWSKDFGVLDVGAPDAKWAEWGFAASPVIADGKAVVQLDTRGESFLAVFDVQTGEELWRTARDEDSTWCTPTVDPARGQVVVNGYKHIGGYDLATGEERWKLVGGGDIPVPTPVVVDDVIYLTSAHGRIAPIHAVRADARGTLELGAAADDERFVWSKSSRGNYMQTPLCLDGILYCCSDAGILAAYDAASGEELYRERLGGGQTGFSASLVATSDVLYATSEEGDVHVIATGPKFVPIAVCSLGETAMATPAIADGVIFWRTRTALIAIGD